MSEFTEADGIPYYRMGILGLKQYYQAIEDALACWEMTTTGNAKVDLNNLLCVEQRVAVDLAVSASAGLLQKQTAMECIEVIKGCGITIFHIDGQIKMQNQIIKAIKVKFGLDI